MSLFAFTPHPVPRWPIATQEALSIALPIIVMTLLGHPELGYIAGTGAFTVLFAGISPVVERAKILPFVAVGLIISAALGVLASGNDWLVTIGVAVVAIIGAVIALGFRLGTPGPVFFVLVFGLTAYILGIAPITGTAYLAAFASGCVFSYLLAMTPFVLPRARATKGRPLREPWCSSRSLTRMNLERWQAVQADSPAAFVVRDRRCVFRGSPGRAGCAGYPTSAIVVGSRSTSSPTVAVMTRRIAAAARVGLTSER